MKNWYTCSIMALKRAGPKTIIGHTPMTITAVNDEEAHQRVLDVCLAKYPAWGGWTDQDAAITQIPQADIDALLASMRE
jgi:hypothetical protein